VSVLLRQAHGFESIRMITDVLLVEDLAFAHRVPNRELQIHLRPSTHAMPGDPHSNSVTGLNEVADRFDCVAVPGSTELLELLHDCLPPYEGTWFRNTLDNPHDGVRVEQITDGVRVSTIPRLVGGSHDLHVLVRNTPSPALRMGDFIRRV
jgi:hypothetical protein